LHTEPLTWIQKNYAYGIKYLYVNDSEVCFQFVSYSKRNLYLRKDEHGFYHVYTYSSGRLLRVEKVYIQIDGGNFWLPKISHVDLYALEEKTKNKIVEVIIP
jgi:hypothetical protein